MRFMVQIPPVGALGDERLLVVRTTKRVRLVRSRLKLIAAHLACRPTGADELDLAKASAIEKGPVPDYGGPAPAHKFTRSSDFSGLSAISRNSLRFKARELHFAPRNETFRTRGLKPLESLKAANRSFRGFVSSQWLKADFVSLRSRMARIDPLAMRRLGSAARACAPHSRIEQALQLRRAWSFFRETASIAHIP
jgi:hypothetical protein